MALYGMDDSARHTSTRSASEAQNEVRRAYVERSHPAVGVRDWDSRSDQQKPDGTALKGRPGPGARGAAASALHQTSDAGLCNPTKSMLDKHQAKPGKPGNAKSMDKAHCARAKAAEERTAQTVEFGTDWVQITEDELSGVICREHAALLRHSWQQRVQQLSAFQQKRCHTKADQLHAQWLADPGLQRRLDKPWMEALASMEYVRLLIPFWLLHSRRVWLLNRGCVCNSNCLCSTTLNMR
jgi:hypothetical protein